jgi:hypothetical protein
MEIEDPKKKGSFLMLPPGSEVTVSKISGGFIQVSYNGIPGWVRRDNLAVYSGTLSDIKSRPGLSKKIIRENGKDYLFFHNRDKLIKYNITDRTEEVSQEVPDFQELYPAQRNGLFILKGISTNGPEADNIAAFDISTGKSVYLGSFREDSFVISDIKFSDDGAFAGILFTVYGQRIICIYRTDSGEFCGYASNAYDFNWKNSILVLNDNRNFWAFDMSAPVKDTLNFSKDNLLIHVKPEWLKGGFLKASIRNDILYIDSRQGVLSYDFNLKTLQVTPLRGLVFNDDMSLNYYLEGDRADVYNFKLKHDVEIFRGSAPEAVFEAFADSNIIGRAKYEKIETLYLYSDSGEVIYRYKAIDDLMAVGETGIAAEVNSEKDLTILSIEDPNKEEFFYIFEKGGK